MTAVNVNNFLLSLAKAIERESGLVFVPAGPQTSRSLWLDEIAAQGASDPSSVLRVYPGSAQTDAINRGHPRLALQVLTRGRQSAAVRSQARALHEAMLHESGRPRVHWRIPGYRLAAGTQELVADPEMDWELRRLVPLQSPGSLGRDDDRQWLESCNWDIHYQAITKA